MKFFKKCILASSIFIIALVLSASALAETGTFNKAAVNLRSKPSSSSSSYGLVNKGATCNILDESGSWLKVKITSHTTNKTVIQVGLCQSSLLGEEVAAEVAVPLVRNTTIFPTAVYLEPGVLQPKAHLSISVRFRALLVTLLAPLRMEQL